MILILMTQKPLNQPKAWKRLRKGKSQNEFIDEVWTDDHFVDERQDENVG